MVIGLFRKHGHAKAHHSHVFTQRLPTPKIGRQGTQLPERNQFLADMLPAEFVVVLADPVLPGNPYLVNHSWQVR